jgi:hypothetical protein
MKMFTVRQGQAQFPALCRKEKTSAITRNGEVVAFIVPRKRMARLLEQMEILANPEAMKAIRRAKAGRTVDYPLSALSFRKVKNPKRVPGKLVRRKGRLMLDVQGEITAEAIAKAVCEERDSRA